jgi:hypothetical protein
VESEKVDLMSLVSVDHQLQGDWRKVVKLAIVQDIPIYVCLRGDTTVFVDNVEVDERYDQESEGTIEFPIRTEDVGSYLLPKGSAFRVPEEQLETIWLNKPIYLEKILPPPDRPLSLGNISPPQEQYDHSDLLINEADLSALMPKNKSTVRSPRKIPPIKQAIYLAIEALGKDATNDEIYKWIKSEAEGGDNSDACFSNIEFDDVTPLHAASSNDCVIQYYSNCKLHPNTKKTFQNLVSKCR